MRNDFDDFMKGLDAEVRHAGPEAVAEAADNVGAAAKKVGDTVEKAADKLVN